MAQIQSVTLSEILDSRGVPTVKCYLEIKGQGVITACAPSGKSVGSKELPEVRDGDKSRYGGKGVVEIIKKYHSFWNELLVGQDVREQAWIDALLKEHAHIGSNFITAISLCVFRAGLILGSHTISDEPYSPKLMINMINGGAHADNTLAFQEFMVVTNVNAPIEEHVRMGSEIFHALKDVLKAQGYSTNVGDEGGYAPAIKTHREALDLLTTATTNAGYVMGKDVLLAIDCAANEFYENNTYNFEGNKFSSDDYVKYIADLASDYPFYSFEDPAAEDDWSTWKKISDTCKCGIIGDDLFATNPILLQKGIDEKVGNHILIKPNQIGTVSQTLETIELARKHGYGYVMSHRSGETEDSIIADLAAFTQAPLTKFGGMSRSERTCKYNRLMEIG